jgi:hypothetical protein
VCILQQENHVSICLSKSYLFPLTYHIFFIILRDPYREQYSNGYSSLRATYTVSGAFEYAAGYIERCFRTGFDESEGSLDWLEQVEKDERIVKALEKNNVEDAEYKISIEMVQRCKQLGEMVREWPSKKENVEYFIASMKNMVAILAILHASDDDLSRIKESFCEENLATGWHMPSKSDTPI